MQPFGAKGLATAAAGELVLHVLGVLAHFERGLASEGTSNGIKARGERPGRPSLHQNESHAAPTLVQAGLSPERPDVVSGVLNR